MLDNETEEDELEVLVNDNSESGDEEGTRQRSVFHAVGHLFSDEEVEEILLVSPTPLEARMTILGEGLARLAENQHWEHRLKCERSEKLAATLEVIRNWMNKPKKVAAERKATKQRKRRAEEKVAPPDPLEEIERGFKKRLNALERVAFSKLRHKRLEQIRGREAHYSLIWKAQQLAGLEHGSKASAEKVAAKAQALLGDPTFNRHKARSALNVIGRLEDAGQPWNCFKRPLAAGTVCKTTPAT